MSQAITAEQLVKLAPPLRESDKEAINRLFQPYLFIGAKGEVWATCCGTHKRLEQGVQNDAEWYLLQEPHCPQPHYSFYRCTNEFDSSRRFQCPWCGAEAKVKRLQYCGARKNLWEYRRAVVLRWWRGALWAVAYDCSKDYGGKEPLTGKPALLPEVKTKALGIYRFRPGRAECTTRSWWSNDNFRYVTVQTAPGKSGKKGAMWKIHSPYGYESELGKTYTPVNMEEIKKSPMRYCGIFRKYDTDTLIEELTACCFYPRQIEMLRKVGLGEIADDMVERGLKNADIVKWDAERPADFIRGLTRQEVREITKNELYAVSTMRIYKRLKGTEAQSTVSDCEEMAKTLVAFDGRRMKTLLKQMACMGINAGKLLRYAQKQKGERESPGQVYGTWLDYLEAAEILGLDLTNEVVQMPGNLKEKHDRVTQAASAVRQHKKNDAFRSKLLPKLVKKYLWWNDDYLIRPAVSAEEITREGKALQHCVGGYADRHVNGRTVILFLRRKDRPGVPMVTIEMNGNRIVQAHGYRNEWKPCKDNPDKTPIRELYKDVFGEWEKWLIAGSKRNKAGEPMRNARRKTA